MIYWKWFINGKEISEHKIAFVSLPFFIPTDVRIHILIYRTEISNKKVRARRYGNMKYIDWYCEKTQSKNTATKTQDQKHSGFRYWEDLVPGSSISPRFLRDYSQMRTASWLHMFSDSMPVCDQIRFSQNARPNGAENAKRADPSPGIHLEDNRSCRRNTVSGKSNTEIPIYMDWKPIS